MARIIKQEIFRPKWHHVLLVKYWWILIILIVLVVFSSEYFFIIKPKVDQAVNGGPFDLASHRQVLAEQKEYLQRLEELKIESDNINIAELEKLDLVLANTVSMPDILKQIDALAIQSGLELIGFGAGYEQGVITISLSFKGGDYQSIKQYLAAIEKNIRIMDVETVTMKELGNILSLTIKSYYLE